MDNDLILYPIVWNFPKPREAFLATRDFMIIRASCAWAIRVKPDAKPNSQKDPHRQEPSNILQKIKRR